MKKMRFLAITMLVLILAQLQVFGEIIPTSEYWKTVVNTDFAIADFTGTFIRSSAWFAQLDGMIGKNSADLGNRAIATVCNDQETLLVDDVIMESQIQMDSRTTSGGSLEFGLTLPSVRLSGGADNRVAIWIRSTQAIVAYYNATGVLSTPFGGISYSTLPSAFTQMLNSGTLDSTRLYDIKSVWSGNAVSAYIKESTQSSYFMLFENVSLASTNLPTTGRKVFFEEGSNAMYHLNSYTLYNPKTPIPSFKGGFDTQAVSLDADIPITFSQNIDDITATKENIMLVDTNNTLINGYTLTKADNKNYVINIANAGLEYGTQYKINFANIKNELGYKMSGTQTLSFTTTLDIMTPQKLLNKFNSPQRDSYITQLITEYYSFMGLNIGLYQQYNSSLINMALKGKQFNSLTDVTKAITTRMAELDKQKSNIKKGTISKASDISEVFYILNALGIVQGYDKFDIKADEKITRAAFTAPLARLLGMKEGHQKAQVPTFNDVPSGYWNSGYIALLAQAGILNGNNGQFNPEQNLNYEDAVEAMVKALGYDIAAKENGGYLKIAYGKKLLTGVAKEADGTISKYSAFQLIYNSLDVDIMQNNITDYEILKGQTLLNKFMYIDIVVGNVVGNKSSYLFDMNNQTLNNTIAIEDEIFDVLHSNVQEYLGYNVKAFVKRNEDNQNRQILYIKPNNVTTLIVNYDKIKESGLAQNSFEYYTDDEKVNSKSLKLSPELYVLYNNQAYTDYLMTDLSIENGYITFIDNNADNSYDVIKITEYETYITDSVIDSNEIISDFYKRTLSYEANDNDTMIFKRTDGTVIYPKELKKWDVLSVAKGKSPTILSMDVTVTANPIVGKISEINNQNDQLIVKIENKDYVVSNFYKNLDDKIKTKLTVNLKASFYLDVFGEIVAVNPPFDIDFNYGYLISAQAKKDLSGELTYKIFGHSGKIVYFTSTFKVTIDGKTTKSVEEILPLLDNTGLTKATTGVFTNKIKQLIRYRLNTSGQIVEIDTMKQGDDETTNSLSQTFYTTTKVKYKAAERSLARLTILPLNAKIFLIPTDDTQEDAFSAVGSGYFINDELYAYESYVSLHQSQDTEAVILYDVLAGKPQAATPPSLVEKITKVFDAKQDNVVEKMTVMQKGVRLDVYGTSTDTFSSLGIESGDVIRYGTNGAGNVESKDNIEFVYRLRDDTTGSPNPSIPSVTGESRIVVTTVYKKHNDNLIDLSVKYDKNANTYTPVLAKNIVNSDILEKHNPSIRYSIMLYNKETKKASLAGVSDIKDFITFGNKCSKVIVFDIWGDGNSIIIYNN